MQHLEPNEPFYQISQAAKLLGITSDRLRTYEEEGLIKPYRTLLIAKFPTNLSKLQEKDLEIIELLLTLKSHAVYSTIFYN